MPSTIMGSQANPAQIGVFKNLVEVGWSDGWGVLTIDVPEPATSFFHITNTVPNKIIGPYSPDSPIPKADLNSDKTAFLLEQGSWPIVGDRTGFGYSNTGMTTAFTGWNPYIGNYDSPSTQWVWFLGFSDPEHPLPFYWEDFAADGVTPNEVKSQTDSEVAYCLANIHNPDLSSLNLRDNQIYVETQTILCEGSNYPRIEPLYYLSTWFRTTEGLNNLFCDGGGSGNNVTTMFLGVVKETRQENISRAIYLVNLNKLGNGQVKIFFGASVDFEDIFFPDHLITVKYRRYTKNTAFTLGNEDIETNKLALTTVTQTFSSVLSKVITIQKSGVSMVNWP